jgi:hypothetical protein
MMDQMQPDLDWEFSERHEPPARVVTRHEPKRAALGGAILLACGCLFILAACAIVSHAAGVAKYRPVAEDAVAELAAAQDTAAKAIDNAEYWQAQALEASATIEALASEVASLTAGYESMRIQVEDLELLNRALKNELGAKITPQSAPKAPAAPKQTSAGAWSADKVAATLRAAAAEYGLDDKQTAWIVDTGVRVAYRESTYRPDARNGQHLGLYQFNAAWGTAEQRLDPVWSCYRFVRVYAEGGEAKIRQHWKATV